MMWVWIMSSMESSSSVVNSEPTNEEFFKKYNVKLSDDRTFFYCLLTSPVLLDKIIDDADKLGIKVHQGKKFEPDGLEVLVFSNFKTKYHKGDKLYTYNIEDGKLLVDECVVSDVYITKQGYSNYEVEDLYLKKTGSGFRGTHSDETIHHYCFPTAVDAVNYYFENVMRQLEDRMKSLREMTNEALKLAVDIDMYHKPAYGTPES